MACTAHRFPAPMILNRYRPPSSSRSQAVSMTCPSIITQPSCSSLAVWSEALNLSRAMSCSQSPMSSLFLAVMGIEMLFVYPVLPYSGEVTEATDTDTDTGQAASISAKRPSMNSSIMLKVLGKPGSPVPDCKRYRSGTPLRNACDSGKTSVGTKPSSSTRHTRGEAGMRASPSIHRRGKYPDESSVRSASRTEAAA